MVKTGPQPKSEREKAAVKRVKRKTTEFIEKITGRK